MISKILRKVLVWAAPFIISYIFDKYEKRRIQKELEK